MNGTAFALPRIGTDVVPVRSTSSLFTEGMRLPSRLASVLLARRREGETLAPSAFTGTQLLMGRKDRRRHDQHSQVTVNTDVSSPSEGRDVE